MNDLEFREQYKRLREVHPHYFGPQEKMNTTWEYVKNLDVDWFRHLVDRLVMAQDPKRKDLDIGEAAVSERRNRKNLAFAEDVAAAAKSWQGITEKGLEKVLEKYRAGSLFDAILKSRKGEL